MRTDTVMYHALLKFLRFIDTSTLKDLKEVLFIYLTGTAHSGFAREHVWGGGRGALCFSKFKLIRQLELLLV